MTQYFCVTNGVCHRCGAGWQPARRLVTAAGRLRTRQWADWQSAAAYQAAPQGLL